MSGFSFNDVLIEPAYSEITSRAQVNLHTNMGRFSLKLPVISANMNHITEYKMAANMCLNGGLGILHRFNTIAEGVKDYLDAVGELNTANDFKNEYVQSRNESSVYNIGVSIGVHEIDRQRFDALYEAGARLFCIDVAHGHHIYVKNMLAWIKNNPKNSGDVVIIAGNIATPQAAADLNDWGADILKIGIGPGAVCQTRTNTGVGVPQLFALKNIREFSDSNKLNLKLIADGGIKTTGDVAKALKYADAVMMGSFIAGTSETPGGVYENELGQFYKVYGGSASAENKVKHGKQNTFVEGMMTTVPFRGHVKYLLKKIKENLQSSCSYVGAITLEEFKLKANLVPLSGGAKSESKL